MSSHYKIWNPSQSTIAYSAGDCGAPIWFDQVGENKDSTQFVVALYAGNYRLHKQKGTRSSEEKVDQIPHGQEKYIFLTAIDKKIINFVEKIASISPPEDYVKIDIPNNLGPSQAQRACMAWNYPNPNPRMDSVPRINSYPK